MIKCIIIEDEPNARNILRFMMAEYFPNIEVVAEFDKVSLAAAYLKQEKIDFVFLDVQLNGEIGLDLVNYFQKDELNFEIIFTTAHSGYAMEAFTISAVDYILKPINTERLKEAVNRVLKRNITHIEQLKILQQVSTSQSIDRLVIKNLEGSHFIYTKDILYLKADNVYTEFYLLNGKKMVVSKPLKEYDILLTQNEFYKSHRSFIVNMNHIKTYHKGEGIITMVNNNHINLARDKKKEFEEAIQSNGKQC